MDDLSQKQLYEFVFHLSPNLSEEDINDEKREIENLISESGGFISRFGEIKKIKLAYPIKNELMSNFGFIEFFAPKEIIKDLNKKFLLDDKFLRYLIIKKEGIKKPRIIKSAEKRKVLPKIEKLTKIKEGEREELEKKEIDKKIEEILEKL